MEPLIIQSSQGQYKVTFHPDLERLAATLAEVPQAMVLVDRKVAEYHDQPLASVLRSHRTLLISASEDEKTLEGCGRALSFLQANNASRETQVVAIGGGILQDIATFCTHVYYRGLHWHYIPTTLLGMADSCIGAKASINFNGFKNQLGVFHSPQTVHICAGFLRTLPEAEIRSGYGEILKLHIAGSRSQFQAIRDVLRRDGFQNRQLDEFVRTSLVIKKSVIEVDEFDNGVRRTLNYGHTFGHALESVTNHGIPHGLAVAWGMDLVNYLAVRRGLLPEADFCDMHDLLRDRFSWKLPQPVFAPALLTAARRDKKIKNGKLNLVVCREPGDLRLISQEFSPELEGEVTAYLGEYSIAT